MKRRTWMAALSAVLLAWPMLLAVGGCYWSDRHDDRDDRDRHAEQRDDHHDDHHDEDHGGH